MDAESVQPSVWQHLRRLLDLDVPLSTTRRVIIIVITVPLEQQHVARLLSNYLSASLPRNLTHICMLGPFRNSRVVQQQQQQPHQLQPQSAWGLA